MSEPRNVIWLGPTAGEFQRPFELLSQLSRVRLCADLATLGAWSALPTLIPPAIVIGANAWPGGWNARELEKIARQWPLTRWIELVGAWNQGAPRTAPGWTGWQAIPAGEFEFATAELLDQGHPPLPRTSTREERLLRQQPVALRPGTRVGVFSRQQNQLIPLLELLESLGCFGVGHWQQTTELEIGDEDSWQDFSPEILLVNLSTNLELALPWLRSIKRRWPATPLVLLADVPRFQEAELARAHQLGPLLGKPVDATRLANALRSVLKP